MKKTFFYTLQKHALLAFFLLPANTLFANNRIDSLLNVLKTAKEDTNKIKLLYELSWEYQTIDSRKALNYGEQGLDLAKKNNFKKGIARSLNNVALALMKMGDYQKALDNFSQCMVLYEDLNDNAWIAKTLHNIGMVYSKKGAYEEAIDFFKRSVNIHISLKDSIGMIRNLYHIGVVYSHIGDFQNALENVLKSEEIAEKLGDRSEMVSGSNLIANIYVHQMKFSNALEYYIKNLEVYKDVAEKDGIAGTMMNIGTVYSYLGKNDSALDYTFNALKIFQEIEDKMGITQGFSCIGGLYENQGNYDEAIVYYRKSLKMAEEYEIESGIASGWHTIGRVYLKKRLYQEAIQHLTNGLNYSRILNNKIDIQNSYESLSEAYAGLNDFDEAYNCLKLYHGIKDSLFNESNAKKIAELQTRYETKKKDQEIALLKKDNELKEAKAKQEKILAFSGVLGVLLLSVLLFALYNRKQIKRRLTLEKEIVEYEQKALHLQMNPHFIFNCLGSISSFIAQNNSDLAITYLSKFSKLMRLTLEYSKMPLIPVEKEIESLKNYLELEQLRFKEKFDFDIKVGPGMEDDVSLPPMLIQPFVENAILHGLALKPEKGKIEIAFSIANNMLVCKIEDNGIGREKSKEMKEQSMPGHKSMAMEITKKRLDMLGMTTSRPAHISIDDVVNANKEVGGTCIIIDLPIQYTAVA